MMQAAKLVKHFGKPQHPGAVVLFGMCTAHLANFTIRQWMWRAPVFAASRRSVAGS